MKTRYVKTVAKGGAVGEEGGQPRTRGPRTAPPGRPACVLGRRFNIIPGKMTETTSAIIRRSPSEGIMARTKHAKMFDAQLRVGVPKTVAKATAFAASQQLESSNDYVRRALLAQLRQDGALPPKDARAA